MTIRNAIKVIYETIGEVDFEDKMQFSPNYNNHATF